MIKLCDFVSELEKNYPLLLDLSESDKLFEILCYATNPIGFKEFSLHTISS